MLTSLGGKSSCIPNATNGLRKTKIKLEKRAAINQPVNGGDGEGGIFRCCILITEALPAGRERVEENERMAAIRKERVGENSRNTPKMSQHLFR